MTPANRSDSRLIEEFWDHLKPDEDCNYDPDSEVARFYAGKSVLVTGATGYVGKVSCWCFISVLRSW